MKNPFIIIIGAIILIFILGTKAFWSILVLTIAIYLLIFVSSYLKKFETEHFSATQLYPDVKENAMSTAFSHIFQGGYSSGYYSYKWAEVLDADAFAYFHEKGIFNVEVATKFKENVLSKGGTEHPMVLYKRFRGKEPKPDALLKRAGLI